VCVLFYIYYIYRFLRFWAEVNLPDFSLRILTQGMSWNLGASNFLRMWWLIQPPVWPRLHLPSQWPSTNDLNMTHIKMFLFFSNHQGTTHFGTFFGDGLETPQWHPEVSGKQLDSYPLKGSTWGFLTMCNPQKSKCLSSLSRFQRCYILARFQFSDTFPQESLTSMLLVISQSISDFVE